MSTPRVRRNRTTLTVTDTQEARIRAEFLTLRDLRALVNAAADFPDTARVRPYSASAVGGFSSYAPHYSITVTDTQEV